MKRELIETLTRRKDSMVGALWSNCVTTDVKILTSRGWLSHEEVRAGDTTIGFNPDSGENEWTEITDVHYYAKAPVIEVANSRWKIRTTHNHKWLVRQAASGIMSTRTIAQMNSESYMIHSVPFAGSEGLPISDDEAAILGWVMGDGYMNKWKKVNGEESFSLAICQAKVEQTKVIDSLLSGITHNRRTEKRAGFSKHLKKNGEKGRIMDLNSWHFGCEFSMDLWRRAGLYDVSRTEFVMTLSKSQLESFMNAMWLAEGHVQKYGKGISQNEGDTADAIEVGIYLLGHKPSRKKHGGKRQPKLCNFTLGRPTMRSYNLKVTELQEEEEVWCVTTGLGTWTAGNGTSVFLTKNSNYDDDKGTRKQAIEEIEENYEEVVQIILHGAEEEPEIDSDNPFFKAAEKGLEKIEVPGNAEGAAAVKDVVNLEHEKYIDQV